MCVNIAVSTRGTRWMSPLAIMVVVRGRTGASIGIENPKIAHREFWDDIHIRAAAGIALDALHRTQNVDVFIFYIHSTRHIYHSPTVALEC